MLKAVIFDMDDTLVDWQLVEPWEAREQRRFDALYDYVNQNVARLNVADGTELFYQFQLKMRVAWEEGYLTRHAPSLIGVLINTLEAAGVPENSLDADTIIAAYNWECPQGLRAFPDVPEVLPVLQSHGVALGIITNSSQPMSLRDLELEGVGLLGLFPTCRLSAVDVGYLKPHRNIFERALKILGVRPEEAVFVGDNLEADVGGAQEAGMYGVLRVRYPELAPDDSSITPDGLITSLHELLPLLDQWYPGWRNGHRA
jgi:putative hydrolase of the HAD superfamily